MPPLSDTPAYFNGSSGRSWFEEHPPLSLSLQSLVPKPELVDWTNVQPTDRPPSELDDIAADFFENFDSLDDRKQQVKQRKDGHQVILHHHTPASGLPHRVAKQQRPLQVAHASPLPTQAAVPPAVPLYQAVQFEEALPPMPAATPSPRLAKRWDDCPDDNPRCAKCKNPPCGTETDVVWVHQTKTIDSNPHHHDDGSPPASSICFTVQETKTFFETEQRVWMTTVFPVESTVWVWEKVPHIVQSASTSIGSKFVPVCLKPPSDWCQDGWYNGVWQGSGDEPCWKDSTGGWWNNDDWVWHWGWCRDVIPPLHKPQIITLIMIPVFLVVITSLWAIRWLAVLTILPFQMYTNLIHELSHVFAGIMGGAKVCTVTIDPGCGPIRRVVELRRP